jgi:hypothetical protein
MNSKATARCSNGHVFEWGPCKGEKQKLFGGTKPCGSHGFEQIYADGKRLTVSFDDRPWVAVQCVGCKGIFERTACPECGVDVPASAFRKKGVAANLG